MISKKFDPELFERAQLNHICDYSFSCCFILSTNDWTKTLKWKCCSL